MLCRYKHALGVPGKGVHRHLGGVAILDVLGTLIGAAILTAVFEDKDSRMSRFYRIALALFALGVFLHWLFCVPTAFARAISSSSCVDNACHDDDNASDDK